MLVYPTRWQLFVLPLSLLRLDVAHARVPALLPGQWAMRQGSFVANQTVPPDILARMDNPEMAELKREMTGGTPHLVVELQPGGTCQFLGQPARIKTGTCAVKGKTLLAQSPGTQGGSSFDRQEMVQLSRRRLVMEFLVGDKLPGVLEEAEYRRVQQPGKIKFFSHQADQIK
ncbi:hypothetical protein GKZ68_16400 [Hymenobacter sp. BRD128]|uniref:hypothetical protein n=1 Tax=Hymenobacter sp. BRD128 TaxID=2675878 RepID=UPI0015659FFF|nr:hypothetical protein [Hymenobacter sp. BRD128]QKG58062.1 hypothetical protein GKZ68_16400 [Hymenobacter sp. BRD128]